MHVLRSILDHGALAGNKETEIQCTLTKRNLKAGEESYIFSLTRAEIRCKDEGIKTVKDSNVTKTVQML